MHVQREREKQTDRQTDRQTTDRQSEREREREREVKDKCEKDSECCEIMRSAALLYPYI